jgi:hypothetical protein
MRAMIVLRAFVRPALGWGVSGMFDRGARRGGSGFTRVVVRHSVRVLDSIYFMASMFILQRAFNHALCQHSTGAILGCVATVACMSRRMIFSRMACVIHCMMILMPVVLLMPVMVLMIFCSLLVWHNPSLPAKNRCARLLLNRARAHRRRTIPLAQQIRTTPTG